MIVQPLPHWIVASMTTGVTTIRRSEAGRRALVTGIYARRSRTEPFAIRPAAPPGTAPAAIVEPIHTPENRTAA